MTTTLGLLFSWLHTLHHTVYITLGNLPSSPSSSCLVHIINIIIYIYIYNYIYTCINQYNLNWKEAQLSYQRLMHANKYFQSKCYSQITPRVCTLVLFFIDINPRRAGRVTVVVPCLCVCLFVVFCHHAHLDPEIIL